MESNKIIASDILRKSLAAQRQRDISRLPVYSIVCQDFTAATVKCIGAEKSILCRSETAQIVDSYTCFCLGDMSFCINIAFRDRIDSTLDLLQIFFGQTCVTLIFSPPKHLTGCAQN